MSSITSLQFLKSLNGSSWKFFRTLTGKPYGGTVQGTVEFSPSNTTSAFTQHIIANNNNNVDTAETNNNSLLSTSSSSICLKYSESGRFRISAEDAKKLSFPPTATTEGLEVTQSYFYCCCGDNDESEKQQPLKILFTDGRPFLNLNFGKVNDSSSSSSSSSACDTHLCGNDTYRAKFEILETTMTKMTMKEAASEEETEREKESQLQIQKFLIEYNVTGPAKDYVSKTTYERM